MDDKIELMGVWERARARADEDDTLRPQHKAWLSLTRPLGIVEDTALLAVPNEFVRDYLDNRLRPYLALLLTRELGRDIHVAVTVQSMDDTVEAEPGNVAAGTAAGFHDQAPHDLSAIVDFGDADRPSGRAGSSNSSNLGHSERLEDRQDRHDRNDRDDYDYDEDDEPSRPMAVAAFNGGRITNPEKDARDARLNPKYTFETYVIGSSNRFTHAAAVAVAEAPARAYNPLFIYGDSGLGKTHLLHAIGHYAQRLTPGLRTRYVSSEEFTNDFINSVRDDKMQAFQARYRSVDLLLIDDIQFLERAERTQEEFFHTFNTLHNANKQIVISSDKAPRQLSALEDRLRTRFEWGLTTDVQAPDLETRIAILRKKAASDGMDLPPEVLEFIASRVQSNIRELEGALIRVTAFASLNRQTVDMHLTEQVLKDLVGQSDAPEITAATIMAVTAEYFQVSVEEITGPSRNRALSTARQMAMYLCRELTDLSLPRVGEKFGGRDHTTVLHAERKVKTLMTEKLTVYNQISELTSRIKIRSRS